MQPLLKSYLDGTLSSSGSITAGTAIFTNRLPIPVMAGFLTPAGEIYPTFKVLPLPGGQPPPSVQSVPVNWYWVVWALDGSLAAVYPGVAKPSTTLAFTIGPTDLSSPGDIGPVPVPSSDIPVPNDSPSILVGCSRGLAEGKSAPVSTYIARSQFWKRSADSITLAPHESVTTGYTSITGLQETSSTTDTVAKSLNASVGAGWGPISASISASLNTSSTSFQQYVATQTDSRYESRTYEADPSNTRTFFRWQLYDVVTISLASNGAVIAQVTTAQHPDVVDAYTHPPLVTPPVTKARAQLSEADRSQLNELLAALRREHSRWPGELGGADA